MTVTAGYHGLLTMADYLADPCPEPALSSSLVDALFRRTPAHAHAEHPRFGRRGDERTSRGEIGSAAHALAFGGEPITYVEKVTKRSGPEKGIEFVPIDWTTKDAQIAQKEIRAAGGIPLLPHQREQVEGVAAAVKEALATLGAGAPEVTMLWQESIGEGASVWCRGRADWLNDDLDVDLKTVDSADPHAWDRFMSPKLEDQAGLRSLGHKSLGHERKIVHLLVELEYPHAWSFFGFDPSKIALAERRALYAAALWRRCLDRNEFPKYPSRIHWASVKPWAVQEFAERTGVVP